MMRCPAVNGFALLRSSFLSTVHYFAGLRARRVSWVSNFVAFLKDDTGATAIEYGLVAAGISLAIIVVVNAIGTTLNGNFDSATR
jgi:pilus assembly protein Flp/PilA